MEEPLLSTKAAWKRFVPVLLFGLLPLVQLSGGLTAWSQETVKTASVSSYPAITSLTKAPKIPQSQISVMLDLNRNTASLYIGLKEVMRFYPTASGFSPQARAVAVRERLKRFLDNEGNPRDIKPGMEAGQVVVRMDDAILVTIDRDAAAKLGLSDRQLALQWANRLREAYGVQAIDRNPIQVASRGFSPALGALRSAPLRVYRGHASWYGPGFHGRRTASGERFNMNALTAAHKSLPLNSKVRVTNVRNGRSAIVRITDRGPFVHGRIIDLSRGAAQAVGMLSSGTAPVVVEVLHQ